MSVTTRAGAGAGAEAATGGLPRLTFLSTGTVRIRPSMRSQPASGFPLFRRLRSLCDRQWTAPLPVGVFLVHHGEDVFLFDTGQSPCCNNANYFPRAALFNKLLSKFSIGVDDGIIQQLDQQGLKPINLTAIILSHLHNDHAGGLEDIISAAPDLPVYVSREHWKAFGEHPFYASIEGATPNHWPKDFSPRIIDLENRPVGPWKQSYSLTSDGKIAVVDTSGHVPGHLSLVVFGESGNGEPTTYVLTGDATYGLDVLDKEEPDGINDDPLRALQSLRLIKEFARQTEVVVLPSHDPDTPRLLAERGVYQPR